MSDVRDHILAREIRRGLVVCKNALTEWSDSEPNYTRALVAKTIAEVFRVVATAIGIWNGDGRIIPGDSQKLKPSGNRPPVGMINPPDARSSS